MLICEDCQERVQYTPRPKAQKIMATCTICGNLRGCKHYDKEDQ